MRFLAELIPTRAETSRSTYSIDEKFITTRVPRYVAESRVLRGC